MCVCAQVNEETGNRRPVMLTLQRAPRAPKPSKAGISTDTDKEEGERERAKTEDTQADAGNTPHSTAFGYIDGTSASTSRNI